MPSTICHSQKTPDMRSDAFFLIDIEQQHLRLYICIVLSSKPKLTVLLIFI